MSRILVVDDMAAIREPVAASLRMAGYKTEMARDGREALEAMKARRPDLVLLDVSMPGLGGIEVLELMRGDPATALVPVILLTAEADRDCVLAAGKWGVRDYILKSSFSLPQLLARIRKHLPPVTPATA